MTSFIYFELFPIFDDTQMHKSEDPRKVSKIGILLKYSSCMYQYSTNPVVWWV